MLSIFFFKQKTAYELRISDWSSDVCSSDLLEVQDDDGREVRWFESLIGGGSLNATPIEVADDFQRMRETYPGTWLFTSATLAVGEDFGHFHRALGLDDAQTLRLDSPFDYPQQARLYLPRDLPEPNDPAYSTAVAAAAQPVIEAAGGGAFML